MMPQKYMLDSDGNDNNQNDHNLSVKAALHPREFIFTNVVVQ